MGWNELSSIMLIPDTSRIESCMERLGHKLCTCIICDFMSMRGYRMGCAARPDCWYQCDIPAYRPRTGDMAARVSGTGPGLVPRPRPSSERLWFIEKSIELYMVTKVDNHGL